MNLKETEQLLREMFAIDGRKLDSEKIVAWKESLGSMQLDVAQQALRICRADERIQYIEPRHLYAKAKAAAEEVDRNLEQKQRREEITTVGTPCPTCHHGKCVAFCNDCCNAMWAFHQTHAHLKVGDDLCHEYMKEKLVA